MNFREGGEDVLPEGVEWWGRGGDEGDVEVVIVGSEGCTQLIHMITLKNTL